MVANRGTDSSGGDLPRLAQLLSQAEHRVRRELARLLEDEGCTIERWRALLLLGDGASHTMSEIAEYVLVPAPSLTRLIDRMVADNLAYRTADPHDRRRVLVRITPRGQALNRALAERIDEEQDRILAEAEAGEVAQLAVLLTELVNRQR